MGDIRQELTPEQKRLHEEFTRGMQRVYPPLNADEIRSLIAKWRAMAEGQSFLLAASFTKCANDLEELLTR
jgi:3-deoxy-D-arabino-heptulosonate 7-phosphate (DAHP) synthase class II